MTALSSFSFFFLLLPLFVLPALGDVVFPDDSDESADEPLRDEQGRRCVPLPQCDAYYYLVTNEVPGMTRSQVVETLWGVMCGYEGDVPKVLCSDSEEEEEDEQEEEDLVAPRAGGVIDLITGSECEGVLKLHHYSGDEDAVGDLKTTVLRRRRYSNLRRLSQRLVFGSQVDGGCCWSISSAPLFAGDRQELGLGARGPPDVQPRAAQKTSCR